MDSALASRIRIVVGDITRLHVDAIVTAANQQLRGGGGVDGAVHAAAGPDLARCSRKLAPCVPGEAKITPGFLLTADFVVHAVGPIFRDLEQDSNILANAYRSSLKLAAENKIQQIAFPCISTGIYGFPGKPACRVAIQTVCNWLRANVMPAVVVFCCFDEQDADLYRSRLAELGILTNGSSRSLRRW